MPFRHIDKGIKRRAVALLARGFTHDEIADLLDVSARSIYRWAENDLVYSDVVRPRNPAHGRPRTLSGQELHEVLVLLEEMPELYLREIKQWIAITHHKLLGKSALHDVLRDMGITYKRLRRDAAERNEEERDIFRDIVKNQLHAGMCVCIDESSKDERTIYRHYGRAPAGQRASIATPFVRGQRYSICPALTLDGYIAVKIIEDSFDAEQFTNYVLEDVLPQMNPFPGERSVLIMDNCRIHKSDVLREAIELQGCRLLFLPAYSPDLHPIEESFSSVKSWIRANYWYFIDHPDPIRALHEACLTVQPHKCRGWFAHSGYRILDN